LSGFGDKVKQPQEFKPR